MERPLTYLKQRVDDDWLIGYDSRQFTHMAEQLYLELTQLSSLGTSPKILLAEREPVRFLAGFIAACAAGCPVFLCNPNWVKEEWQQVFNLVQPDLILGHGEWVPHPPISPSPHLPISSSPHPPISPSIMIPTGGSSGRIRFAIHTWETLMASVRGFQQYFVGAVPACLPINSFCVLPLYHVSGLMQFLRSFTTGGNLVILPFKELEICDINEVVARTSGNQSKKVDLTEFFISLVPTQLQRLLENTYSWLSQFQTVLLGGAPAWAELLAQARRHRIRLAPTYGMTETASQIATLKPEDFLSGKVSCGQVLPHAKVTIRSSTGQLLGANQTGIITIQANSLALGYYPKLFTDRDNFQVDDLGFFDDQGYLNIVGRSSNKIITGGENVYPSEVEAAIRATKLVNDVGVIGVPHHHWGQVIIAVYVPSTSSVTTALLQTAIEDKLSKFKRPKYWIAIQSLPRNSQGKLNRNELQQIAIASLQISPTEKSPTTPT